MATMVEETIQELETEDDSPPLKEVAKQLFAKPEAVAPVAKKLFDSVENKPSPSPVQAKARSAGKSKLQNIEESDIENADAEAPAAKKATRRYNLRKRS